MDRPKLRSFRPDDVEPIDRIWQEWHSHAFSVPDRNHRIIDAVVESAEGKVIAYGQVRHFAEAMLVLDKGARQRDKIQAIKLLMLEAFRGTQMAGLGEIYAFISDPDFSLLIQKHFDFDPADQVGELLIRSLK